MSAVDFPLDYVGLPEGTELATFGPCFIETDLDDAIITLLGRWLSTYMKQFADERSVPMLEVPKPVSIRNAIDDDEFPDSGFPAVIVTTARTVGVPDRYADGSYSSDWTVVITSIVRGSVASDTKRKAATMNGTIRRLLSQQVDGQGPVRTSEWTGSSIQPVTDRIAKGRYLAAGISTFKVRVDELFNDELGPTDPNLTYDPLALVTSVTTEIDPITSEEDSE
jgi:hypothetical protein